MAYFDNNPRSVKGWLSAHGDTGAMSIATGYITIDGLCTLLDVISDRTAVRILIGQEVRGQTPEFSSQLEQLEADIPRTQYNLTELYTRLGSEIQIRHIDNLHAKLYVTDSDGLTGSSNLTQSGLASNLEYNIKLSEKQRKEALDWFELQWDQSRPITKDIIQSVEKSPQGANVVELPVDDSDQLSRVTGMNAETCRRIVDRSLPGQITRLDVEVGPSPINPASTQARLSEFGYESVSAAQTYLKRLLLLAARRRGATRGFEKRLNKALDSGLLLYNHRVWKHLRKNDQAPNISIDPNGMAWLLEWYLQDPSLEGFPSRPDSLPALHEPILMLEPWDHQQEAIHQWSKNGGWGTVEMATATGKTVVGLNAIVRTADESNAEHQQILIVSHMRVLNNQWLDEIATKLGLESRYHDDRISYNSGTITVVTPNRISANFDQFNRESYDLIIVDEVHHYSNRSEGWGQVLQLDTERFLGLSADAAAFYSEANQREMPPVVFEYSQAEAVRDGIVPEFSWLLHPVSLTNSEQSEFDQATKRIYGALEQVRSDSETKRVESKCRCKITDLADVYACMERPETYPLPESWEKLITIVRDRREIIYESQEAEEKTVQLAEEYVRKGLKVIIFTMRRETADSIAERIPKSWVVHGGQKSQNLGVSDRIDEFSQAESGVLLGVQMLDEGIDIPEADIAINTASTRTRLQLLQRQGRILRRNGVYRPVFHHFIPEEEVEYYEHIGSIQPNIKQEISPMIDRRLPEQIGTVHLGEILRSIPERRQKEIREQESVDVLRAETEEWWLQMYLDEFPELFR